VSMVRAMDLVHRILDDRTVEPGEHVVQFYEHEENLALGVSSFLGAGLVAGEAALVVGTAAHRDAFDVALAAAGVDVPGLRAAGRYRSCDAEELLATFLVGGVPDTRRFEASVGAIVAELTAPGIPLRIYGEMVALLWAGGAVASAIRVESLWNDLSRSHPLTLFCAYPVRLAAGTSVDRDAICEQHSAVIADLGPPAASPDEVWRVFEPTPFAVPVARRFVADALGGWGRLALIESTELVVSEMVSNAVRHGGRRFVVAMSCRSDDVRVAVTDLSPQVPTPRPEDPEVATDGRGMHLIAALSRRWGTEVHAPGKTVWAEIAEPAPELGAAKG
jgi:MEDS: MEthanogen/methylotroph, DcmR Sensory domain/Histidine kinase-like ATPase domain